MHSTSSFVYSAFSFGLFIPKCCWTFSSFSSFSRLIAESQWCSNGFPGSRVHSSLHSSVAEMHYLLLAFWISPADGGGYGLSYDFKAGGKISHRCLTFSTTNNTCLAIHLSKSHPVSGWLLVSVMDSRRAKSQVLCSVGTHGVTVLFPLQVLHCIL